MSKILYEVGVRAYGLGVRLAAPFHPKAALWVKGRKDVFQEIEQKLQNHTAPIAWFHCASLGEFEQGRPLIEAFRQKFPHYQIVLTFFSPSGYEIRKNYAGADYIFYLPLDTAENARRFLHLVKPQLAVFVKYEFWHHYTKALRKRHIPLFSISATFRPNQIYFQRNGEFYRRILERFTHIYTQNQESVQLLAGIGFTKMSLAGDTRVDRVLQNAQSAAPNPIAQAFKGDSPVMVIGSSWPQDMAVLLPFLQQQLPTLKFILAPHEIHDKELTQQEQQFPGQAIRYSQADAATVANYRLLLIDNIGMLSGLYQYATYAYVGGAFGKGLHNTLEPAAFGPPIFFGPKYEKFQEAIDLVTAGSAFSVRSSQDLSQKFAKLLEEPASLEKIRAKTQAYLQKQAGATDRILTSLEYWLPSRQA
ncbi:3-deoxy-D-manno-octulosonic acid transferase [Rufibacter glacialis]|uniref:3-deoxy-D-manno-octulosonic acid transferase n=1 Tax=Rufibacter glacialis TaxID=1259555 RepID=A0A5M8QKB1_9BACT|nr:glycosyltransferase N-terminal domain-containing protein [Rufibacter glacialis]KAA6435688.1 3-deoxy-D-manno-octulosonic acid transferase [Rufibacter glacialis]GGK65634.1 3-deoxy-D-manno-octulosonic acid transferase [Rufibacter glacialis]